MHRGETRAWWLFPSHMLVRQAAWEPNEITGGISLVSPFYLTSCPTAARFHCCLGIKHVWQRWCPGVEKAKAGETETYNERNFAKQAVPSCRARNRGAANAGEEKRGSLTVLFLFSQVGSCISASHLRFQSSHVVVCLFRVYEHCHLVVISKASNYSCLHLREDHYINTEALVKIFYQYKLLILKEWRQY